MEFNPRAIDKLVYWIKERHSIWEKKMKGLPRPWTKDEILRDYRFCNVYRELDKVTIWVAENWRSPNINDPELWFAMFVARHINWPDTLADLDYPVPYDKDKFVNMARARKAAGKKLMGGAYMITTHGGLGSIESYLADLFSVVWSRREELRPQLGERLQDFFTRLIRVDHVGNFMAGQVIADTKYAPILKAAPDWWTWACSGPGSMRGLNRLLGKPTKYHWSNEAAWFLNFSLAYDEVSNRLKGKVPELHAQDFQNCLCEFDKYMRTYLGEGTPKVRYNGT
jgi:hypothetical protein